MSLEDVILAEAARRYALAGPRPAQRPPETDPNRIAAYALIEEWERLVAARCATRRCRSPGVGTP
jgi:hypothetical protein